MSDSTRDIREERRWFYARLRRFASGDGTVPYEVFIRSPGSTLDDLDDFPAGYTDRVCLCLYDRGESILMPGQAAVSREELRDIYRCGWAQSKLDGSKMNQAAMDDDIEQVLEISPAADQSKRRICSTCWGKGVDCSVCGGSGCEDQPGSDPAREGGGNAED